MSFVLCSVALIFAAVESPVVDSEVLTVTSGEWTVSDMVDDFAVAFFAKDQVRRMQKRMGDEAPGD